MTNYYTQKKNKYFIHDMITANDIACTVYDCQLLYTNYMHVIEGDKSKINWKKK